MTYKKIFIIVFVIVAAFYVFKVKGYNPFAEEVKSGNVLSLLNGKSMTLDECIKENGAFIFIMGTWCHYCSEEVDHLKSLNDFFQSNKINILIGMEGNSNREIRKWVNKRDFPQNWKTFYWHEAYERELNINVDAVPYLVVKNKRGWATYSEASVLEARQITRLAQNMLKSNK
jgi:hypothetical protein